MGITLERGDRGYYLATDVGQRKPELLPANEALRTRVL